MGKKLNTSYLLCFFILVIYQGCADVSTQETEAFQSNNDGNNYDLDVSCNIESPIDPVAAQRLTKAEYNNVVRDLFNISGDFATDIEVDAENEGTFSTDASTHTVSKQVMEGYWNASEKVVAELSSLNPAVLQCPSTDYFACSKAALRKLARKAFRRPPTNAEIESLDGVVHATNYDKLGFKERMLLGIRAILVSPQFLFRFQELSPSDGNNLAKLNDFELASRLSFFIWGSIPDNALLADAEAGVLSQPEKIREHAIRMLNDKSRSQYLTKQFPLEWLSLSKLESVQLDKSIFPDWNESLRQAMRQETVLFSQDVLENNYDIFTLINSDYTFVNGTLANHYRIPNVSGNSFVKVQLDQSRTGLLTHASFLSINSAADHTTPVNRGKWVLDNILCDAPPPPPMDVPVLESEESFDLESQIRERLAQHQKLGASCFACHKTMDPIGLAFENFNPGGVFRSNYFDGVPVDATGQLPSGENINGVRDLAKVIEKDIQFPMCFTTKLSTFATGRDFSRAEDSCAVAKLTAKSMSDGGGFHDIVLNLVQSREFTTKKVDE